MTDKHGKPVEKLVQPNHWKKSPLHKESRLLSLLKRF